MPTVKDLRPLGQMDVEAFRATYGPVALIQQPPDPVFQQVAMRLGQARTVYMAHRTRLADRLLTMLQAFDHLEVLFLKPQADGQQLTLGRVEGCDVVVHDPSVSKQHALLRWSAAEGTCYVRDAGSMNGTFVNAVSLGPEQEQVLYDGDGVSFGDAQFLFLLSGTLHSHLGQLAALGR